MHDRLKLISHLRRFEEILGILKYDGQENENRRLSK